MKRTNPYRAAGTFDGISYIERHADKQLYRAISENSRYPYILAPRQSGKSSLLTHMIKRLPRTRFLPVFIDLSTISQNTLKKYDAFLDTFTSKLLSKLALSDIMNSGELSTTLKSVLSNTDKQLVIVIDEIDKLLGAEFKDDFFSLIRAFFNERAIDKDFEKLQFVISGTAQPAQLISDPHISPFNVGVPVVFSDISLNQVVELSQYLYEEACEVADEIPKDIYKYTGGQIYLTQLVLERLWNIAVQESGCKLNSEIVDKVIARIIQESVSNVHFLSIYSNIINYPAILDAFYNMVVGKTVEKQHIDYLRMIGITLGERPYRCVIYERVFGADGRLSLFGQGRKATDAKLLWISEEAFEKEVKNAFRANREWITTAKLSELIKSDLASSSLIQDMLDHESASPSQLKQAQGMEALLCWAVEQLRPTSASDYQEVAWRKYLILSEMYLSGNTASYVANKVNISIQQVYYDIDSAIAQVSFVLRQELREPSSVESRRWHFVNSLYRSLTQNEHLMLQLCSIFRSPIPTTVLQQISKLIGITDTAEVTRRVLQSGLLAQVQEEGITRVYVEPRVHAYLKDKNDENPREVQYRWHQVVAEYYQQNSNYLEAAYHLFEAFEYKTAIDVLYSNYGAILANGQVNNLQTLLAQVTRIDLPATIQARLQIMMGDAALFTGSANTALTEYAKAIQLNVPIYYRALALYRRAKAFELRNLTLEALAHYNRGIEILKGQLEHKSLLVDMYIAIAWIYLQERPDQYLAEQNLQCALKLIHNEDSRRRSLLYNALGKLSWLQQDSVERQLSYLVEAWVAATEAQDSELIITAGQNLGHAYVWSGEFDKGLSYLVETVALAQQIGSQQNVAKCFVSIGACHYMQQHYETALEFYHQAYEIFSQTNNQNWLGEACYDLAEAYAAIGKIDKGKEFYTQAKKIAMESDATRLLQDLIELNNRYPVLAIELKPNQERTLNYVRTHGSITRRLYIEQNNSSQKAATQALNKLVKLKLLTQVGQGPSSRYILSGDNKKTNLIMSH